jgi:hypothetical protein
VGLDELGDIHNAARAAQLSESAARRADRALFSDSFGRPILRTCVVTYLDSLGTKERSETLSDSALRDELDDLDQLEGLLHSDFWNGHDQKLVTFSDNVAVAAPTDGEGREIAYRQIDAAANFQFRRLLNGRAIRGGIALGEAFCDGRLIAGPAHVEAVMLEEHTAVVPRVLLSGNLSAMLAAACGSGQVSDPWPRQLVAVDGDGLPFVNYLLCCHPGASPASDDQLRTHRDRVEAVLSTNLDSAVRAKWLWVADYHDWFVHHYRSSAASLLTPVGTPARIQLF